MSDLTFQQRLVFDRIFENNNKFIQLNNDMRGRASFVTAASTAIVGIITAAKFLPNSSASDGFEFILLALVCSSSIGIYWIAALLWKGGNTALTGTHDIDVLYDSYISVDADIAYCNALKDLCSAFEQNEKDNARRGRLLDRMIMFFIFQLLFLVVSIAWTSVASLLNT